MVFKSTICNGVIFVNLHKWRYMTLRYHIVLIIMTVTLYCIAENNVYHVLCVWALIIDDWKSMQVVF